MKIDGWVWRKRIASAYWGGVEVEMATAAAAAV